MRSCFLTLAILFVGLAARAAAPDQATSLCAQNPAFSSRVMLAVIQSQLSQDHDAALDAAPPEQLAEQASAQGIEECAADLRRDASTYQALAGLTEKNRSVGWDAYNTTCHDHGSTRGACIVAETGADEALKRMVATNQPPGAKILVQACQLVMQADPAMTDWRQCVDLALAAHAPQSAASACKISVPWHAAKTGAEAGRVLAACLGRAPG